jgi:hypothetical protein
MATLLRPMSTGELLDRTFFLYRKHFTLFVGIIALPYLILLAMQLGQVVLAGSGMVISRLVWTLIAIVMYLVALSAAYAASVVAVSAVHLERPISIGAAFSSIKGTLLKVMGIMMAVGIGVAVGFVLLIIPGILLALGWSLAIPVAVIEGKSLNGATARSWALTKGDRGRIFVVFFLFFVLIYIVMLLFQVTLLIGIGMSHVAARTAIPRWFLVLTPVATFMAECLVGPLATIALTLIYYDERVKKEGFDLQFMMHSLQGPTGDTSAVPAS